MTGNALKFGEWVALLSICSADDSLAGVRDAALIALFKIAGHAHGVLLNYDEDMAEIMRAAGQPAAENVPKYLPAS